MAIQEKSRKAAKAIRKGKKVASFVADSSLEDARRLRKAIEEGRPITKALKRVKRLKKPTKKDEKIMREVFNDIRLIKRPGG